MVVHEGIIREKPSSKEEARQFLKGFVQCPLSRHIVSDCPVCVCMYLLVEPLSLPGYSGGHVSTVGGVVVTNLTTGKKLGSLDKAEVEHSSN